MALVNDYEVVVKGLCRMFDEHADRIQVKEYDVGVSVAEPVDIALYDTFSQTQGAESDVRGVLDNPGVGKVVVYTWNLQPQLIAAAHSQGAHGYLSKALTSGELVAALERVAAGEWVASEAMPADAEVPVAGGDWPGRAEGLTCRESEIIALITQGLSNKEIAARTFLSINSVKSYIRSAYRRMGVERRSQAVLWGVRHGFALDPPHRVRA